MRAYSTVFLVSVATAVACGSSGGHGGGSAAGGSSGNAPAGRAGSSSKNGGRAGTSTSGKGGHGGTGGTATGTGGHPRGGGTSSGGTSDGGSDAGGAGETGQAGTIAGMATVGGSAGSGEAGEAGHEAGMGGNPESDAVTLTIDTTTNAHPISPFIYGVNPGSFTCSNADAHFGLCRLGGGRWSTYNWETNASNAGDTLCFQNDDALGASDDPGVTVTDLVSEAQGTGSAALVTIPVLDYVAADKLGGTPPDDCSGDVRKSGTGLEYLDSRFKANLSTKGAPFTTPPDTSDDAVYQDEFVAFLKAAAGSAQVLFALDNQPGLWGITQQVVHLDPPTYAEVVARNVEYAKMLRDQWLTAPISGYVGYGWLDFISLQSSPDAGADGLFLDYYLDGLAQASEDDGRRLIDYLDVHWYPEVYVGADRIIGNSAAPDVVASRLQATRSLWDPTYVEDSWITHDSLGNQPLRLIPWLKEQIAAHYPGTKLAISEWNYGGGADVSGAIAAADALGIFGREDVGLAAWSSVSNDDPFVLGAFRVFRNYDGAGAGFGDTSVAASSSDLGLASVYASTDTSDPNRVVIVAINRSDRSLETTLTIQSSLAFTSAATYVLSSASAVPSAGAPLTASVANAFDFAMPAYSVSVIVPAL